MMILFRGHLKRGIVFNTIFYCGLMLIGIVILQAWPNEGISENQTSQSDTSVLDPYEPVGCFKDKKKPERALPNLLRRFSVNETDLANSFAAIIQACATEVYKYGFRYFGVEWRYECWTGPNGSMTYNKHGPSHNCLLNYSVPMGDVWTIFIYRFVEVNGSWSEWSSWQPCSVMCAGGKRTRNRTCSNPAPKWNGVDCSGTSISTEFCNMDKCKVNGSWTQWSSWQPCSVTCGEGHRTRVRTCSNPAPKWDGKDCPGANISIESCNLTKCKGYSGNSTGGNPLHNNETYHGQSIGKSSLPLEAMIVGSTLLALLCLSGVLWFAFRYRRKSRSNSELSDPFEVLFDDILLDKIIGEGAFGRVYRGRLLKQTMEVNMGRKSWKGKTDIRHHQMKRSPTVAVKMLQNGATEEQVQEFLKEILLMKQIEYHLNILNLLACSTITNPMFLVVEFAKNGDLLQYLRKRREQITQGFEETGGASPHHQNEGVTNEDSLCECTSENNRCTAIAQVGIKDNTDSLHDDDILKSADLMTFAWQIAKGMEFLSRKGIVHRDLAARNILVCEGKLVKVADFGLSRNVYAGKVYHSSRNRKLPIKWMSLEAIHDQVFTAESDVWAYGILFWEILTIGETPYPTINNYELLGALKSGYRMEKPQMCSDEMYELMRQCWKENPTERPSFTAIREQLERMMLQHCPYLDMADAHNSYAPLYDVFSDQETQMESTAL